MSKAFAEKIYKMYLKEVYKLVGQKTTWLSQLDAAGKYLFRHLYAGTYPADKIPTLTDDKPYVIINLDVSSKPGSHWVALAKIQGKNKFIFYDSFGRPQKKILSSLNIGGQIKNSEDDAEQHILQTDCGARSLSFLLVFHNHGANIAKYI